MSSFEEKLDSWFGHRHWRVLTELTGAVTAGGVQITYDQGAFEVALPGAYVTPFGSRGRRGYVIAETGEDGRDAADSRAGSRAAFGEAVLRRAQRVYGTVSGLPEESA